MKKIFMLSGWQFSLISFFVFLSLLLNGLRFRLVIKIVNVNLPFREWLGLSVLNTLGNYFISKGGVIGNSIYLKYKYNLSLASFLATTSTSQITSFFAASTLGLVSVFFIGNALDKFQGTIISVFISGLIFSWMLLFIPLKLRERKSRWINFLVKALNHWGEIKKNHLIKFLMTLDALFIIVFAIRLFLCFRAIEINAPLSFCLFFSTAVQLSSFFNIGLSDIGIREFVVGIMASFLGVRAVDAVVGVVLDRAISILWILIFSGIFSQLLKEKQGLIKT
jgi:uncharacterized membrane protein YbhN (UPF0104 family)